jgi:hypothetical protein
MSAAAEGKCDVAKSRSFYINQGIFLGRFAVARTANLQRLRRARICACDQIFIVQPHATLCLTILGLSMRGLRLSTRRAAKTPRAASTKP